jgi:hypothetical protein
MAGAVCSKTWDSKTMALNQSKNCDELRELSDDDLFEYFTEHASFHNGGLGYEYAIRFGSRSLFSDETHTLRDKFFEAVREAA